MDEIIGSNVKRLLDERDLKYKPFARQNKIDDSLFRRLLKGKSRWNTTYLEKISNGLEVSPVIFFDGLDGTLTEISHISPQDEWLYEKRKKWAKEIVPKYPSFNPTTDAFFKVYLEGSINEIRSMETMINSLAGAGQRAGPPEEEKRGRPKKGKDVK